MRLDVVIPTYNRGWLLPRTLLSLLAADQTDALDVGITVVDNQSTDDTRDVVESFIPTFERRLQYVYEMRPGRSHALNAGIAATHGDVVAMVDDDERAGGVGREHRRDADRRSAEPDPAGAKGCLQPCRQPGGDVSLNPASGAHLQNATNP